MNLEFSLLVLTLFILCASVLLVLIKTALFFVILKSQQQLTTDACEFGTHVCLKVVSLPLLYGTRLPVYGTLPAWDLGQVTLIGRISLGAYCALVILHSLCLHKNCPAGVWRSKWWSDPKWIICRFWPFWAGQRSHISCNNIPFTPRQSAKHIEFVKHLVNKVFMVMPAA